ncbi:PEP-CTERM sorting domain-containing protein [Aliivibrio fischeri]|nr:PEP-CTERM sorting domain-containing protein [Aliivibrio fischeri]MUK76778.1 PEP-CTERM sorting domain-containing protein [Aliivibrio fischeri]MUL19560.1 PEP-CTERM sorting domain-containing protein [Aliivibrio fischeri]MUL24858.1 PEP-CTERM sorting domain-containing protein [Aliivibrio fischeri]
MEGNDKKAPEPSRLGGFLLSAI